ncbi:hypothetical protein SEA_FIZZLES_41 [Microbacterium phage Fizzles]|nr:hypothetical protein SEA_FIZZLES_41 [Microbacterium phage Fizzles]
MSSAQVLSIIASLDGGFNFDVPGKQIGVDIVSDTEAVYTLTQWAEDSHGHWNPTDQVERYALTLVPLPDEEPGDPDEPAAAAPAAE